MSFIAFLPSVAAWKRGVSRTVRVARARPRAADGASRALKPQEVFEPELEDSRPTRPTFERAYGPGGRVRLCLSRQTRILMGAHLVSNGGPRDADGDRLADVRSRCDPRNRLLVMRRPRRAASFGSISTPRRAPRPATGSTTRWGGGPRPSAAETPRAVGSKCSRRISGRRRLVVLGVDLCRDGVFARQGVGARAHSVRPSRGGAARRAAVVACSAGSRTRTRSAWRAWAPARRFRRPHRSAMPTS